MNNTIEHQELCDEIMFHLGSHPRIRIWPRRVAYADPIIGKDNRGETFHANRPTKFGIKGEADLQGILAPYGRTFGIEVKTGTGRLNPSQIIWRDMIIRFGGAYLECRSLEQAIHFKNELLAWKPTTHG